MRRLPVLVLGLLALAVLFAFAAPWTFAPAHLALKCGSRVIAAAIPGAFAQEVLEFKPIPPESAAAIEERRRARRAQREATRASQAPPAATPSTPPAPAVAPTPPIPPPARVEFSRSGNIMRVGSDITVEADQTVVGDVLAVGGDVNVFGHVEGDVVSMGGDVHLESSARVDGDVVCMGGQLHEEDGAVVGGQRVTAPGGRERLRHRIRDRLLDSDPERGARAFGAMVWALIALGLAWAFTAVGPGRTAAAADMVRRDPGGSTMVGFLALLLAGPLFLVVIIVGALLCITIIGIPLALAAWAAYGLLAALVWVWGYVIGAVVVGRAVLERRATPPAPGGLSPLVQAALIGVAIFAGAFLLSRLLKYMPGFGGLGTLIAVLSWIGTAVFTMVGSGALIRHEWQAGSLLRRWRRPTDGTPSAPATVPAQWYPATAPGSPPAAPAPDPPPTGGGPPAQV